MQISYLCVRPDLVEGVKTGVGGLWTGLCLVKHVAGATTCHYDNVRGSSEGGLMGIAWTPRRYFAGITKRGEAANLAGNAVGDIARDALPSVILKHAPRREFGCWAAIHMLFL
jgi:hypothetical protein